MISVQKKYEVFATSDSRYYIISGGRASGKSFNISILILLLTFEKDHVILFTRYTLVSASISIIPEFLEKIELLELSEHFYVTKDEIINKTTGSRIIFKGIKTSSGDQTASLKSIQGVTTWVLEEAEELTDEKKFDTIDFSIRSKKNQNRIILILNPTTKEHFIYQKFFESRGVEAGSNLTKGDTTYIHSTYLDNSKNLNQSFIDQIEQMKIRRPEKFKHQILGGWLDKAEGVIFTNWKIGEFQKIGVSVFGQDFGFSTDSSTLIETNIDKANKRIYLKECFYLPRLTTSEIADLNKKYAGDSLIIADSAEPRLIHELKRHCNIRESIKGQGSITGGIALMQDYDLIVSPDSLNLIKELNNYVWLERKSNTPIDDHNHCFIGETLITTINGDVPIENIKAGDYVLTSNGYKKVLKHFDNGVKKVNAYSMQFDTFSLSLCSTDNHKLKTISGWKEISNIKKTEVLYQYKYSTERNIDYIMVKDILVEALKDYTLKYGNIITEIYRKGITYTTLTAIQKITILKTLILFTRIYILGTRVKKGLNKILNGQKNFKKKELKKHLNGINQKKEGNGILNTVKKLGLTVSIKNYIVKYVERNLKQDTEELQNTAIKTARLKHLEVGEEWNAQVYDIMVEDCHEYFANGILVHNCIDAARYSITYQLKNPNAGKYVIN